MLLVVVLFFSSVIACLSRFRLEVQQLDAEIQASNRHIERATYAALWDSAVSVLFPKVSHSFGARLDAQKSLNSGLLALGLF